MVNKDLIKERKRQYGNNFETFSKLLEPYFCTISGEKISPRSAAYCLYLLKLARIKDGIHTMTEAQREDSIADADNYLWIFGNYEEYLELETNNSLTYF